jgi:tRNA dimethylallyltransferase
MQENSKPLLIIVAGPTGVGKTQLAVFLAKELGTSVINADSRQIFRETLIGTARPTVEEQSGVAHFFLGHRSISAGYDASKYESEVVKFLDDWFKSHNNIIMAGGSGLYIDAVCKGIDDLPSIDQVIRQKIRKEYEDYGIELLRGKLKETDPDYYRIADLKNPHRIMKALEIYEMTGRSYSSFRTGTTKRRFFNYIMIGLDLPRHELHERINKRVDDMMKAGLLTEVESLIPFRHLNALNTVGYKELFAYIDGNSTLNEAIENIKAHTRQYARRQLTWFRRYPGIRWFHPGETGNIIKYIKEHPEGLS